MFLYEKLQEPNILEHQVEIFKPNDFDEFWANTLLLVKEKLDFSLERVEYPLDARVYDVTLLGYADTPLRGQYLLPKDDSKKYPLAIVFHGYRGYASSPFALSSYLLNGIAVLAFDIRGQVGKSGDSGYDGGHVPGWMNQGLHDPYECYYRRIIVDALRMVDLGRSLPEIDSGKIFVSGGSQGGGLALATTALSQEVSFCIAAVPNMCHMELGVLQSNSSLKEVMEYLKFYPEKADSYFKTLSYFDILNLAPKIKVPVLVSVGMQDPVCLPKTIFAAYNRITSPKAIKVYPFSGHDGGGELFAKASMEFILKNI